jgi:hypothetical protein
MIALFESIKKITAVFRRSAAPAPQRDDDARRLLLQKKLQGKLSIDEQFALQILQCESPQPKPEDAA